MFRNPFVLKKKDEPYLGTNAQDLVKKKKKKKKRKQCMNQFNKIDNFKPVRLSNSIYRTG